MKLLLALCLFAAFGGNQCAEQLPYLEAKVIHFVRDVDSIQEVTWALQEELLLVAVRADKAQQLAAGLKQSVRTLAVLQSKAAQLAEQPCEGSEELAQIADDAERVYEAAQPLLVEADELQMQLTAAAAEVAQLQVMLDEARAAELRLKEAMESFDRDCIDQLGPKWEQFQQSFEAGHEELTLLAKSVRGYAAALDRSADLGSAAREAHAQLEQSYISIQNSVQKAVDC